MPLNISGPDRRLLSIVAALFVVVIVLGLLLSPNSDNRAKISTTYSAAAEGTKAAYLLLRESGYHSERWEQPPNEIDSAQHPIVLMLDPDVPPTSEEQQAVRGFVEHGGTLLISGSFGAYFFQNDGPRPAYERQFQTAEYDALTPSAMARSAPKIRLATSAAWERGGTGIELYGDDDNTVVMQYPVGKGQVVWLASSSLLSNAHLRESGNLDFLLAMIGSRDRPVLWDEYFHGHRHGTAKGNTYPQIPWLMAQLTLLAIAILLTYSRRSGPMRPPAAVSRLSPLEFVQALGRLYAHAKAANVALDVNYGRFRYWLTRRLGLRANASPAELARAVHNRWNVPEAEFLAMLEACESSRFYTDLSRKEALHLIAQLYQYAAQFKLFPGNEENTEWKLSGNS
jgi:Domain of unknown function (DUF4350)